MIDTDSIQITPEILSLIAEIDEFKGAWRALVELPELALHILDYARDHGRVTTRDMVCSSIK